MTEKSVYEQWKSNRLMISIVIALYVILFGSVLKEWAMDCWELDDFSHCLLIPGISFYILYTEKKVLATCNVSTSKFGLILSIVSFLLYFYGFTHSWSVFERIGMVGCLVGFIGFIFGTKFIRSQIFPFLYLILAIPIPFVIYSKISLGLRGIVTTISASFLQIIGVPAYNDGNLLVVGDHLLGVVDACSGIRSIMAILSVAILFTYIFKSGILGGICLTSLTLPVAVAMNILRVLTMAVFIYKYNIDLTEGLLHTLLGFLIFALIILIMYLSWQFIKWLFFIENHIITQESEA